MDFQKLLDALKKDGLELTEEALAKLLNTVLDWGEETVKATPNSYDDILLIAIPKIREELRKLIDKINGVDDLPEAVK